MTIRTFNKRELEKMAAHLIDEDDEIGEIEIGKERIPIIITKRCPNDRIYFINDIRDVKFDPEV